MHWTQKPIALEPGVHPGDLWSGAGVVDSANTSGLRTGVEDPIVLFTGTNGVRIAYSNDAGQTFQSFNGGAPVLTPPGISRDAKVFWHQQTARWVMAIWSDSGGNGVSFYTSPNLIDWTFGSRYWAPWFYECPDLYPLAVDGNPANTKWVLNDAEGEYVIGSFNGTGFTPDWATPQRMDQGVTSFDNGTFYAGLTFNHMPDGRVVHMAWQPSNQGSVWTGNATFPTELGLKTYPEGIRLTRTPVAEIASVRTSTSSWSNRTITADPASDPLIGTTADTYEIAAEFDLAGATATDFGFRLHTRSDGTYDKAVAYNTAAGTLYGKPLAPVANKITMRLLVDRGQLAVFGNDGKLSVSDNVAFDSSPGSQGIKLYAVGGSVQLTSLTVHRIGSAWNTGQPTMNNTLGGTWSAAGGTWTDVAAGKRGTSTGDAFYLSDRTATNFTYAGDVRVAAGKAAALTFRANATATQHYTVNVDTTGVVKLWRPGQIIATYAMPIAVGRTYRLKGVAAGPSIKVYVDGDTVPVIDTVDSTYASGRFGVNVFDGTAEFQNLAVDTGGLCTDLAARWTPASGTWTEPPGRRRGTATSDGFDLNDQTGTDFTYQADVRVRNGVAAGLTFRANATATQHYTATLDKAGLVKLWRPGLDIATFATPIKEGRTYHLAVTATGPNIRVYLDGGSTPVIDAVDTTYASGRFGLNTYAGTSEFANVKLGAGGFCTTAAGPWSTLSGSWVDEAGGLYGTVLGDAFRLSSRTGGDFTYAADVRVFSGTAAALTFRANATATQHYTATLDTHGVVKLWRPGQVIAIQPATVTAGRLYRLTVVAQGSRIRVYLNDPVTPVIDAVDTTFASGLFGMNVFDSTGQFQNVTVFDSVPD